MHKFSIIIICALALVLSGACGERKKSPLPDGTQGVNLSSNAIEANILALSSREWTPGIYGEILHNQIETGTEISSVDRDALTKMLREAYTDQILRCADSMMLYSCASSHDKLRNMIDSLAAVAPTLSNDYRIKDRTDLNKRYATHEQMMKFHVAGVYGKTVHPDSYYDYSYDNERRSTAASYRKMNPVCETVRKKIDPSYVESTLKKRQADFRRKLEKKRAEAYKRNL